MTSITRGRILLCVAVSLTVATALGFWFWTRTPYYALRQVQAAISEHDLTKFRKYVDVEGVSSDLVAVLNESSGGNPFIVAMSSTLKETVEHSLTKMVESQNGETPKIVHGAVGDRVYDGIDYVKREGKVAAVGLRFLDDSSNPEVMEIRMRDLGGRWQVAGLNVLQLVELSRSREAHEEARRLKELQEAEDSRTARMRTLAESSALVLDTPSTAGGNRVTGRLTLEQPSPGYLNATVHAPHLSATVTLTFAEGSKSENFSLPTQVVGEVTQVPIESNFQGVKRRVMLTLTPLAVPNSPATEIEPARRPLPVYFDKATRAYHVSTCPTVAGRKMATSQKAMEIQSIQRASDCAHLPIPMKSD